MSTAYECDSCGACCKTLIIEIQHLDIIREPKLRAVVGRPPDPDDDFDTEHVLACGKTHPCPMLGPDDRCGIYPTRPNVCVAFQAGDEQCQGARRYAGLAPLAPKEAIG